MSKLVSLMIAALFAATTAIAADAPKAPWSPFVPIMGILICLLLMFSLPVENWYRLIVWMIIGLVIYFTYGIHHSGLRKRNEALQGAGVGNRR
jgi:APA family basic amino acid/polyamine antiporter